MVPRFIFAAILNQRHNIDHHPVFWHLTHVYPWFIYLSQDFWNLFSGFPVSWIYTWSGPKDVCVSWIYLVIISTPSLPPICQTISPYWIHLSPISFWPTPFNQLSPFNSIFHSPDLKRHLPVLIYAAWPVEFLEQFVFCFEVTTWIFVHPFFQ